MQHMQRVKKDIWDNLYATFERQHVGNSLQVHQKLYNFKMEEGISMQAHNNKVHMIVNQFKTLIIKFIMKIWHFKKI